MRTVELVCYVEVAVITKYYKQDIKSGFDECMRVLSARGTLVFKWNEDQIKLSDLLNAVGYQPLFGNKKSKTDWLVFNKQINTS